VPVQTFSSLTTVLKYRSPTSSGVAVVSSDRVSRVSALILRNFFDIVSDVRNHRARRIVDRYKVLVLYQNGVRRPSVNRRRCAITHDVAARRSQGLISRNLKCLVPERASRGRDRVLIL
jgi:hypothetical protein